MCDCDKSEGPIKGLSGQGMQSQSYETNQALRQLEAKREGLLQELIKVQAAIESVRWIR